MLTWRGAGEEWGGGGEGEGGEGGGGTIYKSAHNALGRATL